MLVYCQPNDYWHETPAAPSGYWVEHFDVHVISEPDEAARHLPDAAKSAIIGAPGSAIEGYTPNNPQAVIDSLHFQRSAKTAYELACMRAASRLAARAHRAAEGAFRAGASEAEIHRAYCAAAGQNELELPYGNIVALAEQRNIGGEAKIFNLLLQTRPEAPFADQH